MKGRDNKMEKKKLSVSTGLCYAGGDVGCNIVFGMIGTLLTLFYTDYVVQPWPIWYSMSLV